MTMWFTPLPTLLWLLSAVTLTTQELVKLSVTPRLTAECDQQVALSCNVSSSRNGLLIKHMGWFQKNTPYCSVDSEGKVTHHKGTLSHFRCTYNHGELSLIFKKVQPLESGKNFMCKLQSNRGARQAYTRVELQECCGIAEGFVTGDQASCTFKHVHPDGDVHWFHGSHNLSDGSVKQNTSKSVDKGGWLTIHSTLERKSSDIPYNCSLKSTASGRYIATTLAQNTQSFFRVPLQEGQMRNGVGSQGPMWTFLCFSILFPVTLK
ncbi:uncharacterized protein LOC131971338 [Centropristis striata]|uniref:uncharacterized protein LOC131971338 n=1 Tax=Centropristis striata TaxID=184440 RepID=UPI0027DFB9B2|nr:uncharacterized protein LOC131971338 [Centropristis striata]XP_059188735.1 uncharacterized protein LOC131971338 [Centropristis striata]